MTALQSFHKRCVQAEHSGNIDRYRSHPESIGAGGGEQTLVGDRVIDMPMKCDEDAKLYPRELFGA